MIVNNFASVIEPGSIPVTPITSDWYDVEVEARTAFGFATDPNSFHFRVIRDAPARVHPDARPGVFTADLWQFDAAEFFLVSPDIDRYLEFNLAPNGAWWSCEFTAPRQGAHPNNEPLPGVVTSGSLGDDRWEAGASLPLTTLRDRFAFGPRCRLGRRSRHLRPLAPRGHGHTRPARPDCGGVMAEHLVRG